MTLDSRERELLSIIRNSKDPARVLQIALDTIIKLLEARQEARE